MNLKKFLSTGGIAVGLLAALVSAPANAAREADSRATASAVTKSFLVNSITDAVDVNPGDGKCKAEFKKCTLRAAIQETNALPGKQRIYVSPGTYELSIPNQGLELDNTAAKGDLDVRDDLEIYGKGAGMVVIDGKSNDRVFQVLNDGETKSSLYLSHVTVRKGAAAVFDGNGGGIWNTDGTLILDHVMVTDNNAGKGLGAGIYNGGTLHMIASIIQNGQAYSGGGLYNEGGNAVATIERSAILYNYAYNNGAGILNDGGEVNLLNSTVAHNEAWKNGGGIANESKANQPNLLRVRFSTITLNVADAESANGGGAGGVFNITGATAHIENSIIAENIDKDGEKGTPHPDCFGVFETGGYNVIGIAKACAGLANGVEGDKVGTQAAPVDPLLGSLNVASGPTPFVPISTGSPAIDLDDSNDCFDRTDLPTDQRGHYRESAGGCDGGAVEFSVGCAKPEAPQLFNPQFGQKTKQQELSIEYLSANCADKYKVLVKQDSPEGPKVFKKKNLTGLGILTTPLAKGHTYWLRISACNPAGCAKGEWTPVKIRK